MKKSYRVVGMSCGGCAASVKRAVLSLDPDAEVEVDLKQALVTVGSKLASTEARMSDLIEAAGFVFEGEVPAP